MALDNQFSGTSRNGSGNGKASLVLQSESLLGTQLLYDDLRIRRTQPAIFTLCMNQLYALIVNRHLSLDKTFRDFVENREALKAKPSSAQQDVV